MPVFRVPVVPDDLVEAVGAGWRQRVSRVVLAMLAVSLVWPKGRRRGHEGPPRAWFGPAATAAGLALLLGLNLANPEAIVVRHNLQAELAVDVFDHRYLVFLSDDAVPAVAEAIPFLGARERDEALDGIGCTDPAPDHIGWAAWNWARSEAEAAREHVCPS